MVKIKSEHKTGFKNFNNSIINKIHTKNNRIKKKFEDKNLIPFYKNNLITSEIYNEINKKGK